MRSYFAHGLSGTSVRNVRHFAQVFTTGRLSHWGEPDGPDGVWRMFRTPCISSSVRLRQSQADTSPFYQRFSGLGESDWLLSSEDYSSLTTRLPNIQSVTRCGDFGHLDFIWGMRAPECAYLAIRNSILEQFRDNSRSKSLEKPIEIGECTAQPADSPFLRAEADVKSRLSIVTNC